MNDDELLDEYHSMQQDYKILAIKYGTLINRITTLIESTGDHPSFTLPPVSEFMNRLKDAIK